MTNVKTIMRLFPLLLIVLLASCEGHTDREWGVNNGSYTTIYVRAGVYSSPDTIYETIETGDTRIITITSDEKADADPQDAYNVFSHFLITNTLGDTMHMDYGDNDNWDIYIEQTKHRPANFRHTYTILVTDANFKN